MILSDCSLSFSLPGTQTRRCIKDPFLCHVLFLFWGFVFSAVPFYEITQRLWFSSLSQKRKRTICANTYTGLLHSNALFNAHMNTRAHQLHQSSKVSEASVSFCKSATIRQWALFALSGCWALTRRQEVIYCFCLSLCWLPATRLCFQANRKRCWAVDLQEAHSATGICSIVSSDPRLRRSFLLPLVPPILRLSPYIVP